ncbi:hypothetical protein ES703_72736 [subsurface metagenome]
MYDFSRKGFSRRWYNPPDLFGNAPSERIRRLLMTRRKPPDLMRAGTAPELLELATPERLLPPPPGNIPPEDWAMLGPELQSYFTDMYREPTAAPAPTAAPPAAPPAAPDLTYEDYKAQPPGTRLAGIQPSDMSPYEIQEYADEMAAQRKAEKAQRFQELHEGELRPAPDVIRITGPTGREARAYPGMTRREVSESIGLRRLRRGQISPEQLAGRRQALWERHPSMLREAPDLERDVGRFAGMLPPELGVARARQKYAIEHPEAPTLPRYETTVTRRMPGGVTLTHKPIGAPELSTELEVEQARARLAAEQARKAYWERPATTTVSPIMRMVNEGLLTLDEGKGLATKESAGSLTEKDIISIMHTIERALASTYTPLNEPLGGEEYAERRTYYAQQLEVYKNRLDQIRAGKTEANRVKVKAPDGTIGTLPASQVAEAVKAGYQVITD